jgi:hypothetical protein
MRFSTSSFHHFKVTRKILYRHPPGGELPRRRVMIGEADLSQPCTPCRLHVLDGVANCMVAKRCMDMVVGTNGVREGDLPLCYYASLGRNVLGSRRASSGSA